MSDDAEVPVNTPGAPLDRAVLAFFDVDNTLLRGASVYHLARGARRRGVLTLRDIVRFAWHQARFTAVGENRRHMVGARARALQLISGHTESVLESIADEVYDDFIAPRLWPETVELAREHLRKGHEVWLITATPLVVARVIAARLGLTGAIGTRLASVDGVYTGELDGPLMHGPHKAVEAEARAIERGADLPDCWAYSDSINDVPLLALVGNRVVINPDARLAAYARANDWSALELKPASIRAFRRTVRREARQVRRTTAHDKKRRP